MRLNATELPVGSVRPVSDRVALSSSLRGGLWPCPLNFGGRVANSTVSEGVCGPLRYAALVHQPAFRSADLPLPSKHSNQIKPITTDFYNEETMTDVRAEMTANVWQVPAEVGQVVAEGDVLVILESMKMEIPVEAPKAGTITEVRVKPEDTVQENDILVVIS
jgi:acetyl-CoA carboxylase biotin carboxyl carrier protein